MTVSAPEGSDLDEPGVSGARSSANAAPALPLEAPALARICRGAVRERLVRTRGGTCHQLDDDTPLVDRAAPAENDATAPARPGLDSLEILEIVGDLDRRFALSRTGIEDHLIVRPTLREWGTLIAEHLRCSGPDLPITFTTSGSQGAPRHVAHSAATLLSEVDALLRDLPIAAASRGGDGVGAPARVLALVPCHHIFGFLFGALLPACAGWPVIDLAGRSPGGLARTARAGDLVIATPHLLGLALETPGRLPDGIAAIVSGAPAPPSLWRAAADAGLDLTEIYGATETGGVGWRCDGDGPFTLLSHLVREGEAIRRAGESLPVQDHLEWRGERAFAVLGRRDRQVQVGGVNVSPDAVARTLSAMPDVSEAAVRLDPGSGRLKAFVVPRAPDPSGSGREGLEARLRAACSDLSAPERPQSYTFGEALPRDRAGKPTDW